MHTPQKGPGTRHAHPHGQTDTSGTLPSRSFVGGLAVTAPERSYCSDQATLRGALWQVWKGGSLRGRLIVRRQLLLYGNGD